MENHPVEIEKTGRKHEFAIIGYHNLYPFSITNLTYIYNRFRFIGELFKVRMVSAQVMHECITWLLSKTEDDNAIECLCSVLFAIGKDLETANGKPTAIPVLVNFVNISFKLNVETELI